ncbi:MAG: CpeS-like protein, partial [Cyanobacteriota bacterium]
MTDSAVSPHFPPDSIEAFLRFSAGDWMNLRSQFDLGDEADGANGDEWHTSERGELVVSYLQDD